MLKADLEKRILVLEQEVALLKEKIVQEHKPTKPWWEEIAGTFADDPIYDEAMRLGREYRLSQKEVDDQDDEAGR